MLMEIGRVCTKIAGRESGQVAVVIDNINSNFVMVDGYVRRKRCNINHLDPTQLVIKIPKNASTEEVRKALTNSNIKQKKEKKFIKNFKQKEKKEAAKTPQEVKTKGKAQSKRKLKDNAKK